MIEVTDSVDHEGKSFKAILFIDDEGDKCLSPEKASSDGTSYDFFDKYKSYDLKKLGHTDILKDSPNVDAAFELAKAYFAQEKTSAVETDKPDYKVGDLVEVVDNSQCCFEMGAVVKVTALRSDGLYRGVDRKGHYQNFSPQRIASLSGTYAEQQAKWVQFHGIKVGSKVKVTRPNSGDDDGSNSAFHIQSELDQYGTDGVVSAIDQLSISITLPCKRIWWMPYMVLEPVK